MRQDSTLSSLGVKLEAIYPPAPSVFCFCFGVVFKKPRLRTVIKLETQTS